MDQVLKIPVSLSQFLQSELLCLCRFADLGLEFFLSPGDLLVLNHDLLGPLHNSDLHLFLSDTLLCLRSLGVKSNITVTVRKEMLYLMTHTQHGYMVKDHLDNERGNPLRPLYGLLFPISRMPYFSMFISVSGHQRPVKRDWPLWMKLHPCFI